MDTDRQTIRYPQVTVRLIGEDSVNFAIVGRVCGALAAHGCSVQERREFYDQAMSGDYVNLIKVAQQWVTVI